ncbi:WD40-repeat-containing domain protein [Mycena albidolilacea]|uniref:WD40-repeat-containing domain protein n=1 Tax=Mycena albidolilacea TaxID=1033008 RepID=A0AAD7A0F0_9AGAR|nr:WD40-repeat-containing domain protein [Mycena albidolilacea]
MPDAFFSSSKLRKRKRSDAGPAGPSTKKFARKDGLGSKKAPNALKRNARKPADEELDSDQTNDEGGDLDDLDLTADVDVDPGASGDEDDETPAEKRLRLAKLYLESVKEGLADGEFDAAEIDKELVSARLKQDVLEHSGKMHIFIADTIDFAQPQNSILRTRGHRFSVTCAVASESGKHLFTSGKEGSIVKWDLASGKKLATFHKVRPLQSSTAKKGKAKGFADPAVEGHTDEVLALALSGDGKYLASAGKDRRLGVWDAEAGVWLKGFVGQMGHKDLVSALAFRKGTHQLYTGSYDRTLKVYDLTPGVMGYVETLFGHQDHVLALDALRGETCVSVGGRDKTVRYWKIVEEKQLVFRGGGRSRVREVLEGGLRGEEGEDRDEDGAEPPSSSIKAKGKEREKVSKFVEGSMECVAMIDETTFVSGGDSGSLCLWTTQKKKPIFTQALSHGFNEVTSATEGIIQTPRWVTAVASLRYSDLIASGSWEGHIRIWKLDAKLKSFALIGTVPAPGVVNSLQLLSPPKEFFSDAQWMSAPESTAKRKNGGTVLLVAGLGQEHRLGRWLNLKDGVVSGALVVALSPRTLS